MLHVCFQASELSQFDMLKQSLMEGLITKKDIYSSTNPLELDMFLEMLEDEVMLLIFSYFSLALTLALLRALLTW